MSQPIVDLVIESDAWVQALPELAEVAELGACMALSTLPEDQRDVSICVMCCDDARIAQLNAEFRDKAVATNVLSWPAFDLAGEASGTVPERPPVQADRIGPLMLGDVAIALQTVEREAAAASKPLKSHVLHLILHGSLHLLGYDHETLEDAELMEGIESRAMLAAGYSDPYA